MAMAEPDWKLFKQVREVALERFAQRTLDDCQAICRKRSMTAHERYGELYGLVQERDGEMAMTFDDFRRSTATDCLRLMVIEDLLTDEEIGQFSPEVQRAVTDRF